MEEPNHDKAAAVRRLIESGPQPQPQKPAEKITTNPPKETAQKPHKPAPQTVGNAVGYFIFAQLVAIVWLAMALYNSHKELQFEKSIVSDLENPAPKITGLSLGDVLKWRDKYGYLIGSYKDAATDGFGNPPIEKSNKLFMYWSPSAKTGDRSILIELSHERIVSITVEPKPEEVLRLLKVMQEAEKFNLTSEVDKDLQYGLTDRTLILTKKEGDAILTFDIREDGFDFKSIEFR
jgi:hypothetical protein